MTDTDLLATIRAAQAKATKGPWTFDSYCRISSVPKHREWQEQDDQRERACWTDEQYDTATDDVEFNVAFVPVQGGDTATKQGEDDATLIVAAVNALPRLLELADAGVKAEALRHEVREAAERLSIEGQLRDTGIHGEEGRLRGKMGHIATDLFLALAPEDAV